MGNLPGAIDVVKFAESRSYEINAMQSAMKAASSSSMHRAWQVLPRQLRRRAASHDPRRVPLRLRAKARAEMDPVKKKALGRKLPKLGKAKQIARSEILLKRQRNKRWLETHIWHAKRMKMENMWGYRLAVTPTEKAFRPSHRASIHGSILHDASYQALIELKGPETVLTSILDICCDPQSRSPGRLASGARALDTHFYEPNFYPFHLICPVTIMWEPPPVQSHKQLNSKQKKWNRGKGRGSGQQQAGSNPPLKRVWLRCHPATFDAAFKALHSATSSVLEDLQTFESTPVEIEIADMRGEINVFEIMGPKSSRVLKGALSPVMDGASDEFKKFWASLGNIQSPGAVPRNMIIGFTVHDPRLKFPPKNATVQANNPLNMTFPVATFPTSCLARSDIWGDGVRMKLKRPRFKKSELDDRRAKNLVPGTPLVPQRQDDRVPVLLIQRSIENSDASEAIHGWTIMIPAGWSMAFMPSLLFTGTRVGGQRERQTQSFEAGVPHFPRDFPSTPLYQLYSSDRAKTEQDKWNRTPAAKRPNYEKLGTRCPWIADWDVMLCLKKANPSALPALISTQREGDAVVSEDSMVVEAETVIPPWLLRGPRLSNVMRSMLHTDNEEAVLHAMIEELRNGRSMAALPELLKSELLFRSALVSVKLLPCSRGAPRDLAVIYAIPEDELENAASSMDKIGQGEEYGLKNVPSDSIIGYVTSGGFSLSRGEGFAIGAIPVKRWLGLKRQAQRLSNLENADKFLLVGVRDRGGHKCRLAHIQLLEEERN
ncbi:rnase p protein subunit [Moniliophthora roreri MCA 2997]|nr:rnase p protein subunit [Moniliophthora roreri MCA 2997]